MTDYAHKINWPVHMKWYMNIQKIIYTVENLKINSLDNEKSCYYKYKKLLYSIKGYKILEILFFIFRIIYYFVINIRNMNIN